MPQAIKKPARPKSWPPLPKRKPHVLAPIDKPIPPKPPTPPTMRRRTPRNR